MQHQICGSGVSREAGSTGITGMPAIGQIHSFAADAAPTRTKAPITRRQGTPAAVVGLHRQAQAMAVGQGIKQILRQAAGFRAEQEGIAIGELHGVIADAGAGTQCKQTLRGDARQGGFQVRMDLHLCVLVIVQAGAL